MYKKGSVVTNIFFQFWMLFTPHLCRHAEHGDIQHISFIGIDNTGLFGCHFVGNKVLLYGIGVYVIVDFR